jgi:hypothetical protein
MVHDDEPKGEATVKGRAMRIAARGSVFRCGYCRGLVRLADARAATVRGEVRYVHDWHPVRPGEGRLLR